MTKEEYYRGKPGAKYGVYNTIRKCWQFGISEDTPALAQARLFQKIGEDARKSRFQLRRLPPDGLTSRVCLIDEPYRPIVPTTPNNTGFIMETTTCKRPKTPVIVHKEDGDFVNYFDGRGWQFIEHKQ